MSNFPNINPSSLDNPFSAIEEVIKQYLNNYLFTCSFVEVVGVSGDNNFVNVKPVIQNITTTGVPIQITNNDTIYNVPMMSLFGGANMQISFVSSVGDKGILIACKQDISNFKQSGSVSPVASLRQFSNSDGVFLPLFFQNKQNGIVLKNGDTLLNILEDSVIVNSSKVSVVADEATISASKVALGADGGLGVARLGDQVEVEVKSGSSAGKWVGTITTGSATVMAI